MKDLTNYTFTELYDMLHHVNEYKYPEKIQALKEEIERRKEAGEVPQQLVPKPDWSVFRFRKNKQSA
ncbi:MAG: hypothetical protein JJ966_05395 [Balneolaceae bacterium]|nr:hypothetical protein [Balneolaceae bacterium]